MSTFDKPWQAIRDGIQRILTSHDVAAKTTLAYAGHNNSDDWDLYVVLKVSHDTISLDEFLQLFRSEPVFACVRGAVQNANYTESVWDPQHRTHWETGPFDKFAVHLDLAAAHTPTSFHDAYPPTALEDIPGLGPDRLATLHGTGFESPDDIEREHIPTIRKFDGFGPGIIAQLCDALDITPPGDEPGDPLDECDALTDHQADLFAAAGYDTMQAIDEASNDELLAIDGISNATVWDVRNARLDADSTPEISRYG